MTQPWDALYSEDDRARLVHEPAKRVDAPDRTPFERDRARVVHSAALRRLADKTQVLGPHREFVRNRLTHSLEVAQVGRDVAHVLGCHPDVVETAALAHDLGHPPFGHNGEVVLAELGREAGGFEGNAQTLRLLTRLEAKSVTDDGTSAGLNLTRATLDACTKYPWALAGAPPRTARHEDGSPRGVAKFGVYDDDRPVFDWLRADAPDGRRRCVEAQVMDLADDVAYSVHDVEDGVVAGGIDLTRLDDPGERREVWGTSRDWYLPDATDEELGEAWRRLRGTGSWPTAAYDGTRPALRALKNLTSDVIGRFCGTVEGATRAAFGTAPLVRHGGDVVVPRATLVEISVLKGVAAHYVMSTPARLATMERQRQLLGELVEAVAAGAPGTLSPDLREDHARAPDDRGRLRVVLDHVASLTDTAAVHSHERLGLRASSRP